MRKIILQGHERRHVLDTLRKGADQYTQMCHLYRRHYDFLDTLTNTDRILRDMSREMRELGRTFSGLEFALLSDHRHIQQGSISRTIDIKPLPILMPLPPMDYRPYLEPFMPELGSTGSDEGPMLRVKVKTPDTDGGEHRTNGVPAFDRDALDATLRSLGIDA